MNLIDITGRQNDFVNLDYVRALQVKAYGKDLIALTLTYNDGSEDTFTVSRSRFSALEDLLCQMVLA
jgi:hypothetical protein